MYYLVSMQEVIKYEPLLNELSKYQSIAIVEEFSNLQTIVHFMRAIT